MEKGMMEEWTQKGRQVNQELQKELNFFLPNIVVPDSVINGELLSKTWFPNMKKDVFLSYSHDDEELAFTITGILHEVFGLTVFMDKLVWGSADGLLKKIDDMFCLQDNDHYNYKRRNLSTSHVHAMLTTSIMKVMDQAEAIFFLNTENSTYKLEEVFSKEYTSSPWIYEEIFLTTVLRQRQCRDKQINESVDNYRPLEIQYPLEIDDFIDISLEDLNEWEDEWKTYTPKNREEKHPLDILYQIKGILE